MPICESCSAQVQRGVLHCPSCGAAVGLPPVYPRASDRQRRAVATLAVVLLVAVAGASAYWATVRAERQSEALVRANTPQSMMVDPAAALRQGRPDAMLPLPPPPAFGPPPRSTGPSDPQAEIDKRANAMRREHEARVKRIRKQMKEIQRIHERNSNDAQEQIERQMRRMGESLR